MERASLDGAARELLGRPLTDDEAAFIANACTTMRLGQGDVLLSLLIVYASLMTFLGRTIAAVEVSRSPSAWLARHRGLVIALFLAVLALAAGAFALGQASVPEPAQRDIAKVLHWAFSEEGARARRMSDSGVLKLLEDCSIPGWRMEADVCRPGPDPSTGAIWGIRTLIKP